MAYNLKKFSTEYDYQSATLNYPAVSWVTSTDAVHFDKTAPTPSVAKAVAYFSNGDIVNVPDDGQPILTRLEILGEDRLAEDLTAVEVGDSVTEIEGACFEYCSNLTSVTLTDNITAIGGGAFRGTTSLEYLAIPSGVTRISSELFKGSGISDVFIPDSVTEIGRKAFNHCPNLTRILIPDNVTDLESEVFTSCSSATEVYIGSGITELKTSIFENCSSLTSVTIPSNVTFIGNYAFSNCTNLASVTVEAIVPPSLASGVFDDTSSNLVIYVPNVDVYRQTEGWVDYSDKIQPIA